MKTGKYLKTVTDHFSTALLQMLFLAVTPFSIYFLNKLAECIGLAAYFIIFSRRHITFKNLDTAFGDSLPRQDKKKIAMQSFQNLVKGILELRYYYVRGPEEMNRRFSYEGLGNYTRSGGDRPVVFISAHLGQFPLMVCKFVQNKYNLHLILKSLSNRPLEKLFNKYRWRIAEPDDLFETMIYYSPRFLALKKALRELRKKHSVMIFVDQKFSKGIKVKFFRGTAMAGPGAGLLARKSNAAVMPVFTVRHGTRHKIIIGKELEVSSDESVNTQKFTSEAEKIIRRYPGQWWWFHKRWQI